MQISIGKIPFHLFMLLALAACGGGSDTGTSQTGSSSSSSSGGAPVQQQQQALIPAETELEVFVDESLVLPQIEGGSGTGAISYSSSNPDVLNINPETGELTVVSAGTAVITVTRAGDAEYLEASTDISITISKREQEALVLSINEITLFPDEAVTQPELSGGSGSGALSYSSNNENAVAVDPESGLVTIVGVGTSTITVIKSEDNLYNSAETSYNITIVKREQPALTFESSALYLLVENGETTNPVSGGAGNGSLSFSSSNEDILSITTETGVVTPIAGGTALITVGKDGDFVYAPTQAEYSVEIKELVKNVVTRIGETDAILSWSEDSPSLELYRYTNGDCDIENYMTCDNSNLEVVDSLADIPLTDSFFNASQYAYFKLVNTDELSSEFQSSHFIPQFQLQSFVNRSGLAMTAFNNKLWVTGGATWDDENSLYFFHNDVWSSSDGANWTRETENAGFGPRSHHEMLTFNNELYVFGGEQPFTNGEPDGSFITFEIWTSSDGLEWQNHPVPNNPYVDQNAKFIVFNDKIWAIGGGVWVDEYRIWSSANGRDWEMELESPPFGKRQGHSLVVQNDNLYLYGGFGEGGSDNLLTDVWVTTNGTGWTQVTADTGFAGRVSAAMYSVNNEIHIVGGHSYPDIGYSSYYSEDNGLTWNVAEESVLPSMYQENISAILNDEMWFLSFGTNSYFWTSTDARNWYSPTSNSIIWSAP